MRIPKSKKARVRELNVKSIKENTSQAPMAQEVGQLRIP